jgi:hypothetical protein
MAKAERAPVGEPWTPTVSLPPEPQAEPRKRPAPNKYQVLQRIDRMLKALPEAEQAGVLAFIATEYQLWPAVSYATTAPK